MFERLRADRRIRNLQLSIGGDDVDVIRQEFGLIMVRDLGDRHRGRAGENMRKLALAIRRQVHDDDVGETEVGRQCAEKVRCRSS